MKDKSKPTETNTTNGEQSIEELQRRYNQLNTHKIEAGSDLRNAEKLLDQLKKQALENYGTDDVAQLQLKLEAMTAENEQKRRQYQAELDKIEGDLLAVEQKFATDPAAATGEGKA